MPLQNNCPVCYILSRDQNNTKVRRGAIFFISKCTRNYVAAGLCLDPLGELIQRCVIGSHPLTGFTGYRASGKGKVMVRKKGENERRGSEDKGRKWKGG